MTQTNKSTGRVRGLAVNAVPGAPGGGGPAGVPEMVQGVLARCRDATAEVAAAGGDGGNGEEEEVCISTCWPGWLAGVCCCCVCLCGWVGRQAVCCRITSSSSHTYLPTFTPQKTVCHDSFGGAPGGESAALELPDCQGHFFHRDWCVSVRVHT